MKKLFFLLGIFLFLPLVSRAILVAPHAEIVTVKTEHFYLHYNKEQPSTAKALLGIMEKVHEKVSHDFKWTPKRRTHVLLVDITDDANGWATVWPANYIHLYVTPPDADSSLDNYRDYLEMLFTHEYTHIIHMDQHHKFANIPRFVLGTVVAPNGITPGWMREGMATYEESSYGQGRGHSSYTDMVIRASILENDFPHIDEAAGLGTRWPASDMQYLYGVKFWQWLADRYGEGAIQKYMEKYSSGLWLFSLNNKAKKVYGKSFYQLWREWKQDLTEKYSYVRATLEKKGLTPFTPLVHDDGILSYATSIPNDKGYAYIRRSMDEAPKIVLSQNGKTSDLKVAARGQLSFSGDGKYLAYSALSGKEKYLSYADVFIYDLAKKTTGRISNKDRVKKSERASDPDFASSDGKVRWLMMVLTSAGTDNLSICDFKDKLAEKLASKKPWFDCSYITNSRLFTQFSNPRFSPDGEKIIVSRKDPEGNRDLVLYSRTGQELEKITDGPPLDNHPVWSPAGDSIYFDSDRTGISNIYRYDFKTKKSVQMTNVLTGVYQPQITPDGKTLWVSYYTSNGPTLKQMTLANLKMTSQDQNLFEEAGAAVSKKDPLASQETKTSPSANMELIPGSKKYSAFPDVLVPRYIIPTFLMLDNAFLMGASIGGVDPLIRHAWNVYADYRSDAAFVGGGANYSYLRYNPSLYVGVVRYALNWGNQFIAGQDFIEQRLQEYAGGLWTHGSHGLNLGYFFEDRDNFTSIPVGQRPVTLDRYAGVQTYYIFNRYKYFPRSISREDGELIKLGFSLSDSVLGSAEANERKIATSDLRYYFDLPWGNHHVFAIRGAGGFAWGDADRFGAFRFGGPFGDGPLGSRWFAFRGLPGIAYGGDRALLFSAEYRLPIAQVDRGFGTLPVFLNKISMSFFSDYGNIWYRGDLDHKNFFDDFLLSVGTEIKGDFTVFYGLPMTGRAGYAVVILNQDRIANLGRGDFFGNVLGSDLKNGTFYLQFGQSF